MARLPRKPRAKSSAKASTTSSKPVPATASEASTPESPVQSSLLEQALPMNNDTSSSQDLQDEGSARAIEAITGEAIASDSGETREATDLAIAVEAEVVGTDETDRENGQTLTDAERRRLADLEREVRESFYRAGLALREIRDSRLYRETHRTFEDYCLDALGYKRAYSYELLDAATTFDNLQKCLRGSDILPTSAYQIRPLKKLKSDPRKQADAWRRAVDRAEGRQPTYEAVKEVVAELLPAEIPSAGNQQKNRAKQEQWRHEPTKTIRVPVEFADELLKIAHLLDNGGSLSEIDELRNL